MRGADASLSHSKPSNVDHSDVACCSSCMSGFAELCSVFICATPGGLLDLAPGSPRFFRFFPLGDGLYSMKAARLDSMTGVSSVDLASNQSQGFKVFFQKVARAVRCMLTRRDSHFSVADSPGCDGSYSLTKASENSSTRSG